MCAWCHRFYGPPGGGATTWMQVPMGTVTELAEVGFVLEANERLDYVTDTAAGTGSLKKGSRAAHMRALRRGAKSKRQPEQDRGDREAEGASKAAMEAMGLEVVVVDA